MLTVEKLRQMPALDDEFVSNLRLVELDDAAFICQLRADAALNQHLSPSSPDVAAQRGWIERYKEREAAGTEFYFVVRSNTVDWGVVRMYDFRDARRSFSWGSWIIKPDRPAGLVTYSAVMIYELGFDALGFEQSHFEVRKGNAKVINFHLRAGAIEAGETEQDRLFVFPREKWPAFREASGRQIKAHRHFAG